MAVPFVACSACCYIESFAVDNIAGIRYRVHKEKKTTWTLRDNERVSQQPASSQQQQQHWRGGGMHTKIKIVRHSVVRLTINTW